MRSTDAGVAGALRAAGAGDVFDHFGFSFLSVFVGTLLLTDEGSGYYSFFARKRKLFWHGKMVGC